MLRKLRNLAFQKRLFHRFPDPVPNPGCTRFEVDGWIISDFLIKRLIPIVGVHPYPVSELFLMAAAVCRLKPTHILEWGTHLV